MSFVGIILIVWLVVFIGVGAWVSRRVKTTEDFYVAGRRGNTFLVASTIVASYLSTTAFTGIFASAYSMGAAPGGIFTYTVIAAWCLLIFVLGPRVYRLKAWTIPQVFKMRYGSTRIRTVSAFLLFFACAAYLVSVLVGAGVALGEPLGISADTAVIVSGVVVLFFSVAGGMWGVVVTDAIMLILFLFAALVGFPIALTQGGISNPSEMIALIGEKLPGAFSATGYLPLVGDKWWSSSGFIGWFSFMGLVSACVGLTGAHTISRTFICKNEKVVARSFIVSQAICILFLMLVYLCAPFIKAVAPADVAGSAAYVWMVNNWMPPIVAGLVLAGITAAGLSTASALLQQSASALSNDIIAVHFMKNVPAEQREKKTLNMSRIMMLVIGVVMILISLYDSASDLFILYSWAFASSVFACWLPAMFIGSFSKRVSEPAAFWSILISLAVNIIYFLFTLKYTLPHQVFVALPLSLIVLLVLSIVKKPDDVAIEGYWKMQREKDKKEKGYYKSINSGT